MDSDDNEKNSKLGVVLKNIRNKKEHIEKLNEMIIDNIEEERMAEEMENSAELELLIDTEITLMEEYVVDDLSSLLHQVKRKVLRKKKFQ